MYPYHQKIKQRIAAGELVGWHFTESYPRIGPALVLQFSTYPPLRPIRPNRYAEYMPLLSGVEQKGEQHGFRHPKRMF